MSELYTIKINFRGGIISPGDLYNVLVVTTRAGIRNVSFGLRQQLLIHIRPEKLKILTKGLEELNIPYENDKDEFPNIVSSYPAEEVFINNTWLSEGVYKDIFDGMEQQPRLKINVSDSNQSFTPLLTGNINWVASASAQHFWHLFIRFPKTNTVYEWNEIVYTNDVPRLSGEIESIIFRHKGMFYDNVFARGEQLFEMIDTSRFITKPSGKQAVLPAFNLPYYEGLNRYNNKYWLGVYRRDELFGVDFLKEVCMLCLDTKIGLLCSTPWKSIIIKGIGEKDKDKWARLLEKHDINMRHAANELNFQVEDDSEEALQLKQFLVKRLNDDDTRTFGVCIGIKTRKKTEIFCNILVRRKSLISLWGIKLFHLYDILCANEFNPNERTGAVFSSNNPKCWLGEQLRRSILSFAKYRAGIHEVKQNKPAAEKEKPGKLVVHIVHQCKHCLSIYDESVGEPETGIKAGTTFESLPGDYNCVLCEAPKTDFVKTNKEKLGLQAV
ncbi:MAG: rubredoxin [Ferruginibacter sp.]